MHDIERTIRRIFDISDLSYRPLQVVQQTELQLLTTSLVQFLTSLLQFRSEPLLQRTKEDAWDIERERKSIEEKEWQIKTEYQKEHSWIEDPALIGKRGDYDKYKNQMKFQE